VTSLAFDMHYRDHWISVHVDHREITLTSAPSTAAPVTVVIDDGEHKLAAGQTVRVRLAAADA
jgi:trehalose/maltose hydrolase-like predicted phosphorylase